MPCTLGNQRNQKFRHINRGKLARRKTPTTTTILPPPTQPVTIEESRIINIAKLQEYITKLSSSIHPTQCAGSVILLEQVKRGMAWLNYFNPVLKVPPHHHPGNSQESIRASRVLSVGTLQQCGDKWSPVEATLSLSSLKPFDYKLLGRYGLETK